MVTLSVTIRNQPFFHNRGLGGFSSGRKEDFRISLNHFVLFQIEKQCNPSIYLYK